MRQKRGRAATAATAPSKSPRVVYHSTVDSATAINEVVARFVFSLQNPCLRSSERIGILDVIDGLVGLKGDIGLLKEVHHVP